MGWRRSLSKMWKIGKYIQCLKDFFRIYYYIEFKYYCHVPWCYFQRCSLLNWCVEREKPGTRAVLLAFCATKEWIRPTCAKEKARSIAKLAMARILDPKALDLVLVPAVFKWLKKDLPISPHQTRIFFQSLSSWMHLWCYSPQPNLQFRMQDQESTTLQN